MTPELAPLALAGFLQAAIFVPFTMRTTPERGTHDTTSPRHVKLMDF